MHPHLYYSQGWRSFWAGTYGKQTNIERHDKSVNGISNAGEFSAIASSRRTVRTGGGRQEIVIEMSLVMISGNVTFRRLNKLITSDDRIISIDPVLSLVQSQYNSPSYDANYRLKSIELYRNSCNTRQQPRYRVHQLIHLTVRMPMYMEHRA